MESMLEMRGGWVVGVLSTSFALLFPVMWSTWKDQKKLHQIPVAWFSQRVPWSLRQGDGPIPSISAAICWLFWDGSSRTVSKAVSPRLSFMLTSIPRKAHQVDQGSENFQASLKEGQIPGYLMLLAAQPTFSSKDILSSYTRTSYICNQPVETYTY